MGFGKAIVAKALDLLEDALGKIPVMAPLKHAVDEFLLKNFQSTLTLPGGHGAT